MKIFTLTSMALLGLSLHVNAASFDCSKAKSFAEKTICASPELSSSDDSLKLIYDQAKNAAHNKKEFTEITRRLWNARERCSDSECLDGWYQLSFAVYEAVFKTNSVGGDGKNKVNIDTDGAKVVAPKTSEDLKNEAAFVDIVKQSIAEASGAKNEMQVGGIKASRDAAICGVLTSKSVTNWIGEVKEVSANSDGKGVLSLLLPGNIIIKTWNNSFSDGGYHTLIEPGSSMFKSASSLSPGDIVYFSGNFFESKGDCIEESSLSLKGKMMNPEFIFKFSSINKYNQK